MRLRETLLCAVCGAAVLSVACGSVSAGLYSALPDSFVPAKAVAVGGNGVNRLVPAVAIYTNQASFEADAMASSYSKTFTETFEESNIPAMQIQGITAPLQPGVPNVDPVTGFGFPTGLAAPNIQMNAGTPGTTQFVVIGANVFGNASKVVGANVFADSTIVDVLPSPTAAIGFDVFDPIIGTGNYDLTVRNAAGSVLFSDIVLAGAPGFMGVLLHADLIGSIQIAALSDGGELVDNIQVWETAAVPEPSALAFGAILSVAAIGWGGMRRLRSGAGHNQLPVDSNAATLGD